MNTRIARVYGPQSYDGFRVLVDRLWPRGVSKEQAALDLWAKDIAPSAELRTWFGHKPERFDEFSRRYVAELNANTYVPEFIRIIRQYDDVILLYGAKDPSINHAVVLQRYLTDTLHG